MKHLDSRWACQDLKEQDQHGIDKNLIVLGIDKNLIIRFNNIHIKINCNNSIDPIKFANYCKKSYKIF